MAAYDPLGGASPRLPRCRREISATSSTGEWREGCIGVGKGQPISEVSPFFYSSEVSPSHNAAWLLVHLLAKIFEVCFLSQCFLRRRLVITVLVVQKGNVKKVFFFVL